MNRDYGEGTPTASVASKDWWDTARPKLNVDVARKEWNEEGPGVAHGDLYHRLKFGANA